MWSQGLLSPGQLILEMLGLLPKFGLDWLLKYRGQVPDRPLHGLCGIRVPLNLVEESGEEGCLLFD